MIGSVSKRFAVLSLMSMLLLIWPNSAEEADVLAAAGGTMPSDSLAAQVQEAGNAAATAGGSGGAESTERAGGAGGAPGTVEAAAVRAVLPPAPAHGRSSEGETAFERSPKPPIDAAELFDRLAGGDRTGGLPADDGRYAAPEQPTVYLTFDDGPSKWTPAVLDILAEYGVPATFFVLGEHAEEQEDTVRRIVREGHALGNHTYNHKYAELYGSFEHFFEQTERTRDILERMTGERVKLLRAPGGTATNFDAFYFFYLGLAGYEVHDWNVDSGDSKRRGVPAAEIVSNIKQARLLHEMNVLLHDGAGHEQTVKALPEIIEYFQEKGYRFAVLTEDVKPIAFRVGKVKWARGMDALEHGRMLAIVDGGRPVQVFASDAIDRTVQTLAAAEPTSGSAAVDSTAASTQAASAVGPAARAASGAASEPSAGSRGSQVALRTWAEQVGASVGWDPAMETATVALGEKTLYWNVRDGFGWISGADDARQPLGFALELREERLYAPADALDVLLPGA